ncbi:hypothetical protein [Diplocloster modestus]|uniref:Uncharacterized protein n=1 Tax=Diplocloster modestus TaxID=2850322 RepID=A0ABS6K178_9FIRM|nr:hypothetical protein [Diplocloster modestus]MBU9724420.1 hypothetical protein [Diplocloster modestus]
MVIEINEEGLQEWAVNQIKKRMGDRINTLMREWDWKQYMRNAVDMAVKDRVTDEAVKTLMTSLNKDEIVKNISERIAEEIADSLQN